MAAEDRRGSRINTDRFPKRAPKAQASTGVQGMLPLRKFFRFYFTKVIQTGYWPDFKLESFNLIKILYIYLFKI